MKKCPECGSNSVIVHNENHDMCLTCGKRFPPVIDLEPEIMKVLSVREPWAWLVVNNWKNIENRTWETSYRGPLLIHSSLQFDTSAIPWMIENGFGMASVAVMDHFKIIAHKKSGELIPENKKELGGITGVVNLTRITSGYNVSSWAQPGLRHWHVMQGKPLPFMPCKGQLQLWDYKPTGDFFKKELAKAIGGFVR